MRGLQLYHMEGRRRGMTFAAAVFAAILCAAPYAASQTLGYAATVTTSPIGNTSPAWTGINSGEPLWGGA